MLSESQKQVRAAGALLQQVFALAVVAASVCCLCLMQWNAAENRRLPLKSSREGQVVVVASQRDAYHVCAKRAVLGARIVQLGKFSNLQYWEPEYLGRSAPFPLQVFDVRPEYEKGLQSHNWLLIATRTGVVRKVASVLPPEEFRRMIPDLDADFGLIRRGERYVGFHHDVPRQVTTLGALPVDAEPTVVVADASYFRAGIDPVGTARKLSERVPAVALLIVVSSLDEAEVTWEMRRGMAVFIRAWQEVG